MQADIGFAVALLGATVAWGVWLLLRRQREGADRPVLFVIAAMLPFAVLAWLPTVYYPIWDGSGALWDAVLEGRLNEFLVRDLAIWVPVLLLVASALLVTLSRSNRNRLWAWAFVAGPTVVVMLYVLLVMGVELSA